LSTSEELLYQISLTLINGIGDIHAKTLLAHSGSAKEIFRLKKSQLQKIPGIGSVLAAAISASGPLLKRAEEEIQFLEKYKIQALFFTDAGYPSRLKHCSDSPVLLYYKGSADLNAERIVGVVGTRKPSEYGRQITRELVEGLRQSRVLVISGLAYGIDILAHKTALEQGLDTVGVTGHGMDRIYPRAHERIARQMISQGGLLTDFISGTPPDAVNFPKRNRIVAGLCDALVVTESKRSGGSLITATIANSYNKDVFAFPGQAGQERSEGGNGLIKKNQAALIENAEDLLYAMQWQEPTGGPVKRQPALSLHLSEEERSILQLFSEKQVIHLDEICQSAHLPVSRASACLLQLELQHLLRSRPGRLYELL
jgi:DNA processing protein